MKTHTTWQPDDDLQMRWHGGKTINIYQRTNSSFDWVNTDCFTDMDIKNIEDATDAVVDFYNDLVGTGEIEDYR